METSDLSPASNLPLREGPRQTASQASDLWGRWLALHDPRLPVGSTPPPAWEFCLQSLGQCQHRQNRAHWPGGCTFSTFAHSLTHNSCILGSGLCSQENGSLLSRLHQADLSLNQRENRNWTHSSARQQSRVRARARQTDRQTDQEIRGLRV